MGCSCAGMRIWGSWIRHMAIWKTIWWRVHIRTRVVQIESRDRWQIWRKCCPRWWLPILFLDSVVIMVLSGCGCRSRLCQNLEFIAICKVAQHWRGRNVTFARDLGVDIMDRPLSHSKENISYDA